MIPLDFGPPLAQGAFQRKRKRAISIPRSTRNATNPNPNLVGDARRARSPRIRRQAERSHHLVPDNRRLICKPRYDGVGRVSGEGGRELIPEHHLLVQQSPDDDTHARTALVGHECTRITRPQGP